MLADLHAFNAALIVKLVKLAVINAQAAIQVSIYIKMITPAKSAHKMEFLLTQQIKLV